MIFSANSDGFDEYIDWLVLRSPVYAYMDLKFWDFEISKFWIFEFWVF